MYFLKNCAENEAGKLVPDFFLHVTKAIFKGKGSGLQLGFTIF